MLLVLFLTLHIGKAFHHHTFTDTLDKVSSETHQLKSSSDCSICDYQIAKDSSPAVATIEPLVIQEPVLHLVSYQSRKIASIGLCYSDRGPPAIS